MGKSIFKIPKKLITAIEKPNGQTLVLLTLSIFVLLTIVGLAIDSGIGYGVKAKLSSAVDAAALAAGNAAFNEYSARNAAVRYFNANYPSGYLRSTITAGPTVNPSQTVSITPNYNTGQTVINVTATASVPTYFMRMVGLNNLYPAATAQVTRKSLDMVLVVDTTGSIANSASSGNGVSDGAIMMQSAVSGFINHFNLSLDRVAIIHFAAGSVVDVPINTTGRGLTQSGKAALTAFESNIPTFVGVGGNTNHAEALWRARDQLNSVNTPSSLRVIVFFTDGDPNGFSATFSGTAGAISTDSTGSYDYNPGFTAPADPSGPGSNYGFLIGHPGPCNTPGYDPTTGLQNSGNDFTCYGAGGPYGIWKQGVQNDTWNTSSTSGSPPPKVGSFVISVLPAYFSINNSGSTEFGITANTSNPKNPKWRPINGTIVGYTNINNAARNLAEDIAINTRNPALSKFGTSYPIYIYTLGVGANLTWPQGMGPTDPSTGKGQMGQTILKRVANDPTSDTYNSNTNTSTTGGFFYAETGVELQQAFDQVANQILNLTQ